MKIPIKIYAMWECPPWSSEGTIRNEYISTSKEKIQKICEIYSDPYVKHEVICIASEEIEIDINKGEIIDYDKDNTD